MRVEFKQRLRAAIRTAGLTQAQAAEKIGCSRQVVALWLIGAQPRLDSYERILAAFPELREQVAS